METESCIRRKNVEFNSIYSNMKHDINKKESGTETFNQHNAGSSIPMTRVRKTYHHQTKQKQSQ